MLFTLILVGINALVLGAGAAGSGESNVGSDTPDFIPCC